MYGMAPLGSEDPMVLFITCMIPATEMKAFFFYPAAPAHFSFRSFQDLDLISHIESCNEMTL
jgi:hypothetical protein